MDIPKLYSLTCDAEHAQARVSQTQGEIRAVEDQIEALQHKLNNLREDLKPFLQNYRDARNKLDKEWLKVHVEAN